LPLDEKASSEATAPSPKPLPKPVLPVFANRTEESEIFAQSEDWKGSLERDPDLGPIVRAIRSGKTQEFETKYPKFMKHVHLDSDILLYNEKDSLKMVVPFVHRKPILNKLHNLFHKGVKGTLRMIKTHYWWPGMAEDVKIYVRACLPCTAVRAAAKGKGTSIGWSLEPKPFEVVQADFAGPLPLTQYQNKYILLFIDRNTGWVELIPTPDNKAETAALFFYRRWVCQFGAPLRLVCDNGTHFTSEIFRNAVKRVGTILSTTLPWHPQSNGKSERIFREVGSMLKLLAGTEENWDTLLPTIKLAIHSTPNRTTGYTPAQLVLGKNLRLPFPFVEVSNIQKLYDQEMLNFEEKGRKENFRAAADLRRKIFHKRKILQEEIKVL